MGGAFLSRASSLLRAIRPALLPGQTSLPPRLPSLLQVLCCSLLFLHFTQVLCSTTQCHHYALFLEFLVLFSICFPVLLTPRVEAPREITITHDILWSSRLEKVTMEVETLLEYEKDQPFDAEQIMDKESTLNFALHQLVGDFDRESNLSLSRFFSARSTPVISTGSLKLDLALGIGGLPKLIWSDSYLTFSVRLDIKHNGSKLQIMYCSFDQIGLYNLLGSQTKSISAEIRPGRMVEIYGKEASGKTTLALHIIKEAQRLGAHAVIPRKGQWRRQQQRKRRKGCCAYLDPENAMNPSLAETMGVNTNNLLISRVDCAEKTLSIVNTLVNSGFVDVIVVDSVAALVPQCELDDMMDIYPRKVQSRLMTQALRKIHYSLCRSQTLLIFVNQVRTNLRSTHGFREQDEVTCGGNALKFYAAVRMRIRRNCLLHSEDKLLRSIYSAAEVLAGFGKRGKLLLSCRVSDGCMQHGDQPEKALHGADSCIPIVMPLFDLLYGGMMGLGCCKVAVEWATREEVTGVTISVEVIKNKLAPAMKKANLNIRFGRGLCHEEEILEMAAKHGIIRKEENGYWIKGNFFKDHLAAEQFLAANNGVASDLVDVLRDQLLEANVLKIDRPRKPDTSDLQLK
ncbi:DNA repair protein recA [Musa troglodytarum]|uniref:DNA repair protein recA n=1 Tax=Musa troglodytarum TaxID=320322 RepID=A0A9E7J9F4_9LILI|nr:DNA repair protein recA [Musa troglodytarum]